jgi:DNA helicase-2/ATP-dependent DNA helicase PcrA
MIDEGTAPGELAIFYRTHAQSRPFEDEFLKYNIPYVVVGGTRFYDRAEVKDALAYLRVLRNPNDTESMLRIVNRPARGIGKTSVDRVLEVAEERGTSFADAIQPTLTRGIVRGTAARRLPEFIAMLDDLRVAVDVQPLPQLLSLLLERTGYLRSLELEGTIEAEARLENLRELVSAVEEFERLNREGERDLDDDDAGDRPLMDLFLEQVTLLSEADLVEDTGERVPLMTVHVAKGLEFPTVFLVGLEEGLFPHMASLGDRSAIEEERRLCYVGMTRAKERLYLTNARLRRMHGSARYNSPSRFLEEIPPELGVGRVPRPPPGADIPMPLPPRAPKPVPEPASPAVDYSDGQFDPGELPPLQKGMRVEHPIFGTGTIGEVIGSGPKGKIRVRFDRAGIKTIVTRYAQLRLIS